MGLELGGICNRLSLYTKENPGLKRKEQRNLMNDVLIKRYGNDILHSDEFEANVDEFLDDKAYQNYRQCILTMSELANQWIIIEK